jgi:hypothetical protein
MPTSQFQKSFVRTILDWETLAYDLAKAQLLDTEDQWQKPSITSAASIFNAMRLTKLNCSIMNKGDPDKMKELEALLNVWKLIVK